MKGQASIEYILIYVFALAIILSTVATFTYLNLGDVNTRVPETCDFGVSFECRDYTANVDGNVTLEIKNTDEDWHDIRLKCKYPSGAENTGPEISGVTKFGDTFRISCGPEADNGFVQGTKARIDASLEYHKGLTTFENYRSHDGTVVVKVK